MRGWVVEGWVRGVSGVRKNERLGPCYRGWIAWRLQEGCLGYFRTVAGIISLLPK